MSLLPFLLLLFHLLPTTKAIPPLYPPLQNLTVRQFARPSTGFLPITPPFKSLLLVNGTSDHLLTASFYPEPGKNSSNYSFVFVSNNTEILDPDKDISLVISDSPGLLNLSVALDFNKFPGSVQLSLEARNLPDGTLYDSASVNYLAAGLAVYTSDTRDLISGAGRSFQIPSYKDVYTKSHWDFSVFVQYLNGSSSEQRLDANTPTTSFSIDDIQYSFISYTGQIPWDPDFCTISNAQWDGEHVTLPPNCGAGFARGKANETFNDGLHFAYDFEKHRAGRVDLFFEWEAFTVGTEFEDEVYTNYVLAEIGGTPPAVVTKITPNQPFDQNGGEEVFVHMFNTANANITSFDVNDVPFPIISGSKQIHAGPEGYYETARFATEPGTGKRLSWTISATRISVDEDENEYDQRVPVVDETGGYLFSYDDEFIWVSGFFPPLVPETGGIGILTGKFGLYFEDDPSQTVLIGNVPLNKSDIISWTADRIEFRIPERIEIGAGWVYEVVVQRGNSYSVPRIVRYQPSTLSVKQQVFGASSDFESDLYTVSHCGNSTYIVALDNYGGAEGTFQWKLLNSSNHDLLLLSNASGLNTTTATLHLPNEYLPNFDTAYKIVSEIAVGNLSTSSLFLVQRSHGIVVGVTLVKPENRTIAYPQVNMRVVAKIEVPECSIQVSQLDYEWEYENKARTILESERMGSLPLSVHEASLEPQFDKYIYSHSGNSSGSGPITTTRLGRELYLSRGHLAHGLHRIRLIVKSSNETDPNKVFGAAKTSVSIRESPLKAIIGSGQISRKASDAEDFYVSGQASFDPDIVSGNPTSDLSYEWGCQFSLYLNLSHPKICHHDLLPLEAQKSSIFKVTKESLQKHSSGTLEEDEGQVYIRYTLTVRKEGREGVASQDVALVQANGRKLASYERIEVTNAQGDPIDCQTVQFWEDVILSPVASSRTEWRFRLDYPPSEKSQFLAGNAKIIARPGYYISTGSSAPGFQRLPLGIKADKLTPHQLYIFSIALQEPGKVSEEIRIGLKTVEVPELLFPTIQVSKGTVDTIFRAMATTSFHGNAAFSFQFYLLEQGKQTREYCVDGCTGVNVVRFQVPKPGTYTLQCRLLAANGRTLLQIRNNTAFIEIESASASNVEQFDREMDKYFSFGDDGAVNQKGFYVTQSMHEEDGKVVALSGDSSDETCANYTKKWAKMSRSIIQNELPNTANTRNYVSLASNFARLKCVEESETLYELLGIVDESITRTPQEETLTTVAFSKLKEKPMVELEEELVRFYNFSMTRALSHFSGGSSRGRLMPVAGEVNNLVLDLSEMWMKHITASATSGRFCGWDATYTSNSVDGEPDQSLTPSRRNPPLGVNTIRVAVMCNKEQGTSLSTPYASFTWCDSVYKLSGSQRKLITVAESFDYPYFSGVQGANKSDSSRIVMVDITTLGESNKLVSAMSDSMVMAQAEADSEEDKMDGCYQIGLTMGDEAMTRSDQCSQNVAYHMWPRKVYGRQISQPFEKNIYQRRTLGVTVTPETRNKSQSVVAVSNLLGLYGASRTRCGGNLAGKGLALGGILLGIMLTLLVLVVLVYALVSNLFVVASPDDEEMMVENYVERDFFGRGQVRLNLARDDISVSSSEASSCSDAGSMQAVDLDLEGQENNVPDHSSLLAATKSNLPERPPS